MADAGKELAPITFRFEYRRHGWAEASISAGKTTYEMVPSYVPTDPLFELVRAVARLLAYGDEMGVFLVLRARRGPLDLSPGW